MKFNVDKPSNILGLCISLGIIVILVLLRSNAFLVAGIFLCSFAITLVILVLLLTTRKIIISERGVEYLTSLRQYHMSWDEIQEIGFIFYSTIGRYPKTYFISNDNVNEFNYKSAKISKTYFKMAYRKEAVDEIKKYWHHPINMRSHTHNASKQIEDS